MKTYPTYQEAKIANPECEIYRIEKTGVFAHCIYHKSNAVRFVDFDSDGIKCNPADYCMTVEQFLRDGYEFVEGDVILRHDGRVLTANENLECYAWNILADGDNKRFILRADALGWSNHTPSIHADSEFYKKPRTKVEFVNVEFENVGECVQSVHDNHGEYFFFNSSSGEYQAAEYQDSAWYWKEGNLYRRVETEIDERQEFIGAAMSMFLHVDDRQMLLAVVCDMFDSGKFKLAD